MTSETGTCSTHSLHQLASATAHHLKHIKVRREHQVIRDGFVSEIDDVACRPASVRREPTTAVRGLRHAPRAFGSVPASISDGLAGAARSAFGHVHWTEFYQADPWSAPFLADFANGEGVGPDGKIECDRLILGLFLLGPDTLYPPHAHPAEEFYLCLSGKPEFQIGAEAPFATILPGQIAWHASNVSHAIRTGPDPFLAIFGWRGAIKERSWYKLDMVDERNPKRYPKIVKN